MARKSPRGSAGSTTIGARSGLNAVNKTAPRRFRWTQEGGSVASIGCPVCGMPRVEDSRFCARCGADFQASPPAPPSGPAPASWAGPYGPYGAPGTWPGAPGTPGTWPGAPAQTRSPSINPVYAAFALLVVVALVAVGAFMVANRGNGTSLDSQSNGSHAGENAPAGVGVTPQAGHWVGSEVDFDVDVSGSITNFRIIDTGGTCYITFPSVPVQNGVIQFVHGTSVLDGTFTTPSHVKGTFTSSDLCSPTAESWDANLT